MKRFTKWTILLIELWLAYLFIRGGIRVMSEIDLPAVEGTLAPFVDRRAVFFYGFVWLFAGGALVAARFVKWTWMRGAALMAMYLSCVYVIILRTALDGFSLAEQWLAILVGLVAAVLYLRWRYIIKEVPPPQPLGKRTRQAR